MFVPFISRRSSSSKLVPRKGGGGHGSSGGHSSSGGGGSKSSSSGGSSSSSSSSSKSSGHSISAGGSTKSASSYGKGSSKVSTIPSGQLFAGRSEGGGNRGSIFGSRAYGSGYPGISGRGVRGRGFPFYFWPIVWGSGVAILAYPYLDGSEYGSPDNSTRPGGPMTEVSLISANTASNSTFSLISDNTTTAALLTSIQSNCSSYLSLLSSSSPASVDPSQLHPEEAIQYYRASSIALTLDGYNNTGALSSDDNTADTALPSTIDATLLDCLNQTIGAAAPLVSGAVGVPWAAPAPVGVIGLVWIVCFLSGLV